MAASLMLYALMDAPGACQEACAECVQADRAFTRLSFNAGGGLYACRAHEGGPNWVYVAPLVIDRTTSTVSFTRGSARMVASLRRNDYGEFVVRCYVDNGRRYPDGDAFETDKQSAQDTARAMANHRLSQHFRIEG